MKDFKENPLEFYYHLVFTDKTRLLKERSERKKPDFVWLTSNKGHLIRFGSLEEMFRFCVLNGIVPRKV